MNKQRQNLFIKLIGKIMGFFDKMARDNVSAFSGQSSYFFVMAIFPFALLLLTLLRFTPISADLLLSFIFSVLPSSFHDFASSLINGLYDNSDIAIVSFSVITAIWSASKGVYSILNGLNKIYEVKKTRNYFLRRIIASIYTLAFMIGIVVTLLILVFGNSLLKLIGKNIPLLYDIISFIISIRGVYMSVFLSLIFLLLYKLVPNKEYSTIDHLPGAIFSAVGWEIFSFAYSIYVDFYAGQYYIYGSLTTIILLLLWIYVCIYIIFIGAEINVYFRNYFISTKNAINKIKEEKSGKD